MHYPSQVTSNIIFYQETEKNGLNAGLLFIVPWVDRDNETAAFHELPQRTNKTNQIAIGIEIFISVLMMSEFVSDKQQGTFVSR